MRESIRYFHITRIKSLSPSKSLTLPLTQNRHPTNVYVITYSPYVKISRIIGLVVPCVLKCPLVRLIMTINIPSDIF